MTKVVKTEGFQHFLDICERCAATADFIRQEFSRAHIKDSALPLSFKKQQDFTLNLILHQIDKFLGSLGFLMDELKSEYRYVEGSKSSIYGDIPNHQDATKYPELPSYKGKGYLYEHLSKKGKQLYDRDVEEYRKNQDKKVYR